MIFCIALSADERKMTVFNFDRWCFLIHNKGYINSVYIFAYEKIDRFRIFKAE